MHHTELVAGRASPWVLHTHFRAFVRSVRFRLTIWFGLILSLVLLAFSAVVYSRQVSTLEEQLTNQLQGESLKLFKFYNPRASPSQQPESDQTSPLAQSEILLFADGQGRVLRTLGLSDVSLAPALARDLVQNVPPLSPEQATLIRADVAGQAYIFYLTSLKSKDGQLSGADSTLLFLGLPFDESGQLNRLATTLIIAGPATLLLALAGGYWLASRAMRPVRSITRMAHEISETDLSRRLNLNVRDEIGELADTFDQMLDRLQAAFERQRQFTADASHELRTPLTIVSLEVNRALAHHRAPQDYERALAIIGAENEYMGRLVNDLLILARADAGQAGLKHEYLDLGELTLDVVERLGPLAWRNEIELMTDDPPELKICGDRVYLTQMLTNLLENAIKYTGGVGRHVWIECERQSMADRAWGCIRVKDDGPGIPAEHLPHLFDRFYRVDKARTHHQPESEINRDAASGSGLGLAIVHWVASSHGGTIDVHSRPGEGAIFQVRLPLTAS